MIFITKNPYYKKLPYYNQSPKTTKKINGLKLHIHTLYIILCTMSYFYTI